jgi:hypothetical protein
MVLSPIHAPEAYAISARRRRWGRRFGQVLILAVLETTSPASAGPPYVTDDPEPTDYQHFEIYAYTDGTVTRSGRTGETGIDFNYGGAPDLQLSSTIALSYAEVLPGATVWGVGNIEFGVKYRFMHQDDFGWDVSAYPQVFLPSASARLGEPNASLFLPMWMEKDWGVWSTFGGGGCTFTAGRTSKDWCTAGWALTRHVLPDLDIGAEIYHSTPDVQDGRQSTGLGVGAVYDLSETYHLLASYGPGIQNATATDRMTWYTALEFTF